MTDQFFVNEFDSWMDSDYYNDKTIVITGDSEMIGKMR